MKIGHGFKILDPTGATYPSHRDGSNEMVYALPGPNDKYGPWNMHPDPAKPDGKACGPGGFHVHKRLSWAYAPVRGWPWFCQWRGLIGEDDKKMRVRELRLRRIAPRVLWRALRPPFNWGHGANLSRADLRWANLSRADLSWANLRWANLSWANLSGANLRWANLSGANLRWANLSRANLRGTDLSRANLRGADLSRANLSETRSIEEMNAE